MAAAGRPCGVAGGAPFRTTRGEERGAGIHGGLEVGRGGRTVAETGGRKSRQPAGVSLNEMAPSDL